MTSFKCNVVTLWDSSSVVFNSHFPLQRNCCLDKLHLKLIKKRTAKPNPKSLVSQQNCVNIHRTTGNSSCASAAADENQPLWGNLRVFEEQKLVHHSRPSFHRSCAGMETFQSNIWKKSVCLYKIILCNTSTGNSFIYLFIYYTGFTDLMLCVIASMLFEMKYAQSL